MKYLDNQKQASVELYKLAGAAAAMKVSVAAEASAAQ